ncbi:metal-dependent phosphohydrolase [Candidatus Woesearchaeota archaeon]|nr:metal-dependent phosphohydrolase [Candidatus Woesearchaeota archaeon]
MKKQSQSEQNKSRIISLLEETGRPGIDDLVEWLIATDFFQAPASTRLDYHGCHEGGLAVHSLNVYDAFEEKARLYSLDLKPEERTIASLCHDFCKIDLYQPNLLKSGNLSGAKPYVVKDDFPYGHGEKSVLLVSRHIELTNNEALLIRWHMGPFDAEWENYHEKVALACPAIYAFHNADQEASRYLDARKRP